MPASQRGARTPYYACAYFSCSNLGAVVTLTDVPRVTPLLSRNLAAAVASGAGAGGAPADATTAAEVRPLMWGDVGAMHGDGSRLLSERGPFDVILCCEVVYQQVQEVLRALLQTIAGLLACPGGRVVFAYQHRDGSEYTDALFFRDMESAGFSLVGDEPLTEWDESWNDTCVRFVRTYAVGDGSAQVSAAL
ncbi:unnamed protein product [Prorocentrum cordatum]|uniref:Calmodulin-lysine N-methyltransferase n=1 Tax=Prorocentrum cordatum TaxID=2364126 RepID=A0ABN9VXA8_9DINO|nr:unnamed protein product [Polarella glacialis]